MSQLEQRDIDNAIGIINAAMVRLLIGNDWFGDHQIREIMLDEFNAARRTFSRQGWVVIDKPFNTVLERLDPDEPLAVAVRWELDSIRKTFDAHFRLIKDN